ncbi:MAG: haloalkane dehalogenase [Alphaproteobacteria bacterium]
MVNRTARHGSVRQILMLMVCLVLTLAAALPVQAQRNAGLERHPRETVRGETMPYPSQFVEVLGATMHYVAKGSGDPILFIHGNPTSSYLWRNVMPFVAPRGRVIALDLIGMGKSDQPDLDYRFATHSTYVDGFIEALGLENVTLVLHDWGSMLGLDYARRHTDNIKAVVLMEPIIPPAFPVADFSGFGASRELFEGMRTPGIGEKLVLEQNLFVERILPGSILRPLSEREKAAYGAPYPTPASRKPTLMWPRELPVGGTPEDVTDRVLAAGEWLSVSHTPKLLLYARPGALFPPSAAAWAARHYRNMDVRFLGYGFHFVQEDEPEAIGRHMADWLLALAARSEGGAAEP